MARARRDPGAGIPLATLLSWALVACTIEIDNAFEASMPHRTAESRTAGEPPAGPWLASVAGWYACLQHVPADGIPVRELEARSFGQSHLHGTNPAYVRWGFVTLEPPAGETRAKPPAASFVVRPTPAGRRAQARWAELGPVVEQRWIDRLGAEPLATLRGALEAIDDALGVELPDYVPRNATYHPRLAIEPRPRDASAGRSPAADHLVALLAHALVAITGAFEARQEVSLVHAANLLRPLADGPIATRDLPRATGVARETLAVLANAATKLGLAVTEPAGRGRALRLTDAGQAAHRSAPEHHAAAEADLRARAGARAADALRSALTTIVRGPDATTAELTLATSPLRAACEPPPTGWRARRRPPEILPHHPAVSHRGSYPDGA